MLMQVEGLWEKVLISYGPMWVIILFVTVGLWRTVHWISPMLRDLLLSHRNLVDTLAQELPKQRKAAEDTARVQETQSLLLDDHGATLDRPGYWRAGGQRIRPAPASPQGEARRIPGQPQVFGLGLVPLSGSPAHPEGPGRSILRRHQCENDIALHTRELLR